MSATAQDTPTVTISPESGEVEKAVFTIEIDGLQPDRRYTVEILFEGEVVFSSEETSDQAGHIPYPVSSTEGDLPGIYTLKMRVLLDGEVITSGEFTLSGSDPAEDEERDDLGDVTVSPETWRSLRQGAKIAHRRARTASAIHGGDHRPRNLPGGLSPSAHQR